MTRCECAIVPCEHPPVVVSACERFLCAICWEGYTWAGCHGCCSEAGASHYRPLEPDHAEAPAL